jgi:Uncharacterized protein conserved in bacteria
VPEGILIFLKGGILVETLDTVKELISQELTKLGYSLYSLKLTKGKNSNLEIVVDREAPINIDDITNVSDVISKLLDVHEFINGSYVLDVSSLGIEKPIDLTKLEKYKDQYVNIHLTHPYKGESYLEGSLVEINSETIKLFYFIKGKKTTAELERKYIDKARLAIKF